MPARDVVEPWDVTLGQMTLRHCYRAVTHSRIDSRIYGVSRYERYVTRTS